MTNMIIITSFFAAFSITAIFVSAYITYVDFFVWVSNDNREGQFYLWLLVISLMLFLGGILIFFGKQSRGFRWAYLLIALTANIIISAIGVLPLLFRPF